MTLEQRENKRLMPVVKANDLIQKSRYDLSVQQQKLLLYVISGIKPEDKDFYTQQFTMSELCEVCGIAYNNKNSDYIFSNLKKIRDLSYTIDLENERFTFAWLQSIRMDKTKNNLITVKLDEDLKPYLLQLNQFFTSYVVGYIYPMNSKYSIRLYELLKSYENIGAHTFELEELKEKLQTAEYSRYANFKRKVIDIALEEINEYTDITITFKPIREGRNIAKLYFEIKPKTSTEAAITRIKNNELLEENINNETE